LVNNNRLVFVCIKILRLLLAKKLHYNEIIRQTSPDRTLVDDAIDTLEKGQLIVELKMSRYERKRHGIHSQAKIMHLTDLGRELADMVVSVELYKESHEKLLQAVRKHFAEDSKNIALDNILRNRGWKKEEIEFYYDSLQGIRYLTECSGMILKEGLFRRYIDIVGDFGSLSGIAKSVLNNLVMEAISYQISILLSHAEQNYPYVNLGIMDHNTLRGLLNDTNQPFPDIVFNQVKNMLLSDLCILKPSKEEISTAIQGFKSFIERKPEIAEEVSLAQPRYSNKCLLAAYEQYAVRSP
jgi:hypothetical protein